MLMDKATFRSSFTLPLPDIAVKIFLLKESDPHGNGAVFLVLLDHRLGILTGGDFYFLDVVGQSFLIH